MEIEAGTTKILIKNIEKVQKPDIQFAAPTFQQQQQQAAPTFNNMRFDIPNYMPAEDSRTQQYFQQQQVPQQQQQQQQLNPLQYVTAEPATTEAEPASNGCRKLANGQSAPCAKVYENESEQQQQQPIAIPQTSTGTQQATVYGPQQQTVPQSQVQQQQQQQPQNYQTNVYDPFALFHQAYAAPNTPTFPSTAQQQQQQQQQQLPQQQLPPQQQVPQHQMMFAHPHHQQQSPQTIPQPNHSYNPYWPFQGYYDYSQNPSAAYGVQTAFASGQGSSHHSLFGQATKTPVPRPHPLPVPTIEEVEKAIPPAGRQMIYNVARTLLNLY
uniref:Uncharacterized protein n=1 Tax=Panagrolaimus superbus TaxID=310955 RepID=A0A914YF13_9BILA